MFENEEWRVIEGFPRYRISTHGRVKHEDRDEARKITINDKGFPIVVLFGTDSKTRYVRQINKLVAEAFLRPPHFEKENAVWHLDGDLTNCHVDNLRWDTRARVLEWNEMHRTMKPRHQTPRVRNNRTGMIYANAFECAIREGRLESEIILRVERQGRSQYDETARYQYLRGGE